MNRVNVSIKRNRDDDYEYGNRNNSRSNNKNENDKTNFLSSVKTMNHRTNRQNISTTEFVGVPLKKIINKSENPQNSKNNSNTQHIKNSNKKIYNSNYDSEYNSDDEKNKRKQHPDINNYVQYIKNNILKKEEESNVKKNTKNKRSEYYEDKLKSIDSETEEAYSEEERNSDEEESEEENNIIKLNENNIKLSENSTSAEIISFKIYNKLEPIISDVHLQKNENGIRFIFDINSSSLKQPSYLLNYRISRNIFLATIMKKDSNYQICRTIEYSKLQFEDEPIIKFMIEDIYSHNHHYVQEMEINLLKIMDKSLKKKKFVKREEKSKVPEKSKVQEKSKVVDKKLKNTDREEYKNYREPEEKPKVLKKSKNFKY